MAEPFVAEVRIWALNFAPRGWAFCNGALLPISQNTALFSLVGTTYGGDGRTTLGLPNLEGRAAMHPGTGPGLTPRELGENIGSETQTLTPAQLPAHSHALKCQSGSANTQNPSGAYLAAESGAAVPYTGAAPDAQMSSGAINQSGVAQAHNNMQPYLALNFCIALTGIFPPRS